MNCPNCSVGMDRISLEGVHGPEIELDVCFSCHAIWFDKRESVHLAPGGTLDLFRVMSERPDDARHGLGSDLRCPRCRARLSLFHDIARGGRFQYYACPNRHGRLTPFSEFLKEKQFVRTLNPSERHRLRAEVKQVQCSGCGAPVDVSRTFACAHCGAPIAVLDPDAVGKTLHALEQADAARSLDPTQREARARALAALENLRTDPYEHVSAGANRLPLGSSLGGDLLTTALHAIFGRI